MNLLNKTKATCPHCQYRFWRVETCKGISFCPNCHRSVLIKSKQDQDYFVKHPILLFIGLFILFYILSLLLANPNTLINNDLILLFFIMVSIVGNIEEAIKRKKRLLAGIDNLYDVKKDLGDYQSNVGHIGIITAVSCPHCQSQRMQDMYSFKENAADELIKVSFSRGIKNKLLYKNFIGCLNCYSQFLRKNKPCKRVLYSTVRNVLQLILLLEMLLVIFAMATINHADIMVSATSNLLLLEVQVFYIFKSLLMTVVTSIFMWLLGFIDQSQSIKPLDLERLNNNSNDNNV